MENINAAVETADANKGVVSPFFNHLMANQMARAFGGSVTNRNRKIPYRVNHLLVDTRQNSFWTEQFLSAELNLDGVATRLVDEKVRLEVLSWLRNGDNYSEFMRKCYPMPFVKFGDRSISAPRAVSVVSEVGGKLSEDAGYVITDMLLHVLAPTETIEPTDPWYTSDVYLGTFPRFKDVVTELLRHELSTALVGLPAAVTKNVSGKIAVDILAQRVQKQFEEVIIRLQNIGEYSLALRDVLLLVRARNIPDVYLPSVLDPKGGKNNFDTDWLENPTIRELAGNFTVHNIAMEDKAHTFIRTMPHRLDTWITRVGSFLRGGGRYRELSVSEFKSRYSKASAMDNFGVKRFAVLSQNVAPPAAAQVLGFTAGDKSTKKRPVKMYEVTDSTQDLTALFGEMPKRIASDHIAALSLEQLTEDVTLNLVTDSGVVHFAMDRYQLGKRTTFVQSEYDRGAVELALAIACYEEVYLVEGTMGSGDYGYMFETVAPRTPYQPVSGVRDYEVLYLADPAEAIMMAEDWTGTYTESTHVQVIPNRALRMPYINLEPILFIDLKQDLHATIGYKGSIGGQRTFNTNLMELMGKTESNADQAVAPLMVNAQGNNYYAVLTGIQYVTTSGANQVVTQAASSRLITEITALAEGMSKGTMSSYSTQLRRKIATALPLNQQQQAMATMESKLYQTQINVVLTALLTRRLGVFAIPEGKDDVLLSVLGSAAFFLKYEMAID